MSRIKGKAIGPESGCITPAAGLQPASAVSRCIVRRLAAE
jgi:hypothetical protein